MRENELLSAHTDNDTCLSSRPPPPPPTPCHLLRICAEDAGNAEANTNSIYFHPHLPFEVAEKRMFMKCKAKVFFTKKAGIIINSESFGHGFYLISSPNFGGFHISLSVSLAGCLSPCYSSCLNFNEICYRPPVKGVMKGKRHKTSFFSVVKKIALHCVGRLYQPPPPLS